MTPIFSAALSAPLLLIVLLSILCTIWPEKAAIRVDNRSGARKISEPQTEAQEYAHQQLLSATNLVFTTLSKPR